MTGRDLRLRDILILFDRDSGISIFQNFRGYDDPVDDAEWILERNPKTKGFLIRPVSNESRKGLWIGEYAQDGISIRQCEVLYDKGALQANSLIENYINHKITEREMVKKLNVNRLKKKLNSEIIRNFKYYGCPPDHFYDICGEVKRVYESLKEKYGDRMIPYSQVADDIPTTVRCSDVIVCPLKASNAFERIHNLNRALKSRKIGEVEFVSPGIVRLT
ncbi:MAG: hypothetical protein ACE5NN_04395 [Candidatus Bathyarchaeia archaeon]